MFKKIDTGAGVFGFARMGRVLVAIAANFGLIEPKVRDATGTADTIALGDKIVTRSNAGAQTETVPTNATVAFDIGTTIELIQTGAGVLTIAPAGGVTIVKLAAKTLAVSAQYGRVRLTKLAVNTWHLAGDLT